jgi:CO dehydrogenase/acetyl-CoA synthase alpha subunit
MLAVKISRASTLQAWRGVRGQRWRSRITGVIMIVRERRPPARQRFANTANNQNLAQEYSIRACARAGYCGAPARIKFNDEQLEALYNELMAKGDKKKLMDLLGPCRLKMFCDAICKKTALLIRQQCLREAV